jgi:uncharacterized protein (DUF1800 family)
MKRQDPGIIRPMFATLALAGMFSAPALVASKPGSAVPKHPDDKTILHVLNRIGFGPRPGDIARVRHMGLAAYIDQQLHPERIADAAVDARLASFETLDKSSSVIAENYYLPAQEARRQAQLAMKDEPPMKADAPDAGDKPVRTPEEIAAQQKAREVILQLSEQKILRAAYSDRQLEEVLTDFWFNHFNVFAQKGATQEYVTSYERDVIRPHILGKFRDLLEATAKSPAMLFYLDNWQSVDPNGPHPAPAGPRGRGAFFARPGRAGGAFGLRVPMPLGRGPNAKQNPNAQRRGLNENYGRELMELHTLGVDGGYTQQDVINVARAFTGWTIEQPRMGGGFRYEPRFHDEGQKVVLGHVIEAGGGEADGEQVLDILASQPSTARFISTKLVRRFVSDNPPQALVDRAAARFLETGGDVREVVRLIITSPEFFSAQAYRAKVKTPFEFVVSAVRALGVDVTNAQPFVAEVRQLGMPLYMCQPPTGYADRADAWVNTGALLARMNFALQMVGGRMRAIEPAPESVVPSDSAEDVRSYLESAVLADDLSAVTSATIAKAADPRQAAALTLGSPEFQRR